MNKTIRLLGTFAIAALIALSFASCGGGGGGGGDGGGSGDASKLLGVWKRDDGMVYLKFENIQWGASIDVSIDDNVNFSNKGSHDLEGNVISAITHSFKFAFEGEKLRVSEFKVKGGGSLSLMLNGQLVTEANGLDGLYTKL